MIQNSGSGDVSFSFRNKSFARFRIPAATYNCDRGALLDARRLCSPSGKTISCRSTVRAAVALRRHGRSEPAARDVGEDDFVIRRGAAREILSQAAELPVIVLVALADDPRGEFG